MNMDRMYHILNTDKKFDIFYEERPVWIQGINDENQMAKVGFVDNFEEKNVLVRDLHEKNLTE